MLFLFSESIIRLLKQISADAASIMTNEMEIPAHCRSRSVHFEKGLYRYTLNFVLFEGKGEWGYFNPHLLEIGLNKKLFLLSDPEIVRNILRHELVHFYQHLFDKSQSPTAHHDAHFRELCLRFFKDEQIGKAAQSWDEMLLDDPNSKKEKILEKVKKLLALADSSNPHEAEVALKKVNQLILEHNLKSISPEQEYIDIYLKRICQTKRFSPKLQSIREILDLFQVRSVLNHGMDCCYLEIIGSSENIKIAEYIFHFLQQEFEHLWEREKKSQKLKGQLAKNSFFRGLAEGFKTQITLSQSQMNSRALIVSEKALDLGVKKLVYPRLRFTHSHFKEDSHARQQGRMRGEELKIRRALEGKTGNVRLLNFFKS